MSAFEHIRSEKRGSVGVVVFDHPEIHNAVSTDMAKAVPVLMQALEADPDIRVIVVTGAGNRAFIAGSNISKFGEARTTADQNAVYHDINETSYLSVYRCTKPTIARIDGYCIGGGLDYATSCDIRICSDTSSFAIPAVKLGLGYGWEGQERIARIIGPARARDLFFTGRRFNANEALQMGLVNYVVPKAELDAFVEQQTATIAANAPMTIAALKAGFLAFESGTPAAHLAGAQARIDACYGSRDYQEGRAAFAEKRVPKFEGR